MPDLATEDGWPPRTWADRRSDAWYRLLGWWSALRHPVRRWGPRCAAEPPWRLADAQPCCIYRGHDQEDREHADWHADGWGFIWNASRWAWRGPIVSLADELRDHPARDTDGDQYAVWTEDTP